MCIRDRSYPGAVAVDSTSVYWTTFGGAVMKVPLDGVEDGGGGVVTLASGENPSTVAVNGQNV